MNDPLNLNVNLEDVSTAFPRLASGKYPFAVESVEVAESSSTPGNHNLLVIFSLLEPQESHTGDILNPGYQVRKYYPLQQSKNPDAPDFRRDIKLLLEACGIEGNLTNDVIPELFGKEVEVTVKLTNNEQYGDQNEVRGVRSLG